MSENGSQMAGQPTIPRSNRAIHNTRRRTRVAGGRTDLARPSRLGHVRMTLSNTRFKPQVGSFGCSTVVAPRDLYGCHQANWHATHRTGRYFGSVPGGIGNGVCQDTESQDPTQTDKTACFCRLCSFIRYFWLETTHSVLTSSSTSTQSGHDGEHGLGVQRVLLATSRSNSSNDHELSVCWVCRCVD